MADLSQQQVQIYDKYGHVVLAEQTVPLDSNPGIKSVRPFGAVQSGIRVTEDIALTYSVVWRCVNLISDTIAWLLPWNLRRSRPTGNGSDRVLPGEHSVARMYSTQVNPELSSGHFRKTITGHALTWGNGYAEIDIAGSGGEYRLWPITPDRVDVARSKATGQLYYDISTPGEPNQVLLPDEMFHIKGLGFDGLKGYSVIRQARQAIGLGLATESHGASFFGQGAFPSGILKMDDDLSDDELAEYKREWHNVHEGPYRAGKVAILPAGMSWETIGIPNQDAQYLQTRQFQVSDIGPRWFGVPAALVGDNAKATFNNFEQMMIQYVTYGVMQWIRAWEEESNWKLTRFEDGLFTKLNVQGLMRGDQKTRAEFYRTLANIGVLSLNDIRELEDMNPVEGGNLRLLPLNMAHLHEDGTVTNPNKQADKSAPNPAAFSASVSASANQIVKKEAKAIRSAVRRHAKNKSDYNGWAMSFYSSHKSYVLDLLLPSVESLVMSSTGADAEDGWTSMMKLALRGYADNYAHEGALWALGAYDAEDLDAYIKDSSGPRASSMCDALREIIMASVAMATSKGLHV